jgi:extracellular factor (EF) 3-hydroxypalmitic acid methyl ester biosynthesis protein
MTTAQSFERGYQYLNAAHTALNEGNAGAVEELAHKLRDYRPELGKEWPEFARAHCSRHPVREKIHESPFTRRCWQQPRGYPGDPVILDYIFGYNSLEGVSDLGRALYERERHQTGCRSVRARRNLLAAKVDETASRVNKPRILSVACGHLREAQVSEAVARGKIGEYVALDQDPESLAVVDREQRSHGVRPLCATVRSLLSGKTRFDQPFDFVYAAGLYDYLKGPVAARLTSILFDMLRPGGHLLLANFHSDYPDAASMEAILTWWLVYRDESQMSQLCADIDPARVAGSCVYRDELRNLVFLEVVHA